MDNKINIGVENGENSAKYWFLRWTDPVSGGDQQDQICYLMRHRLDEALLSDGKPLRMFEETVAEFNQRCINYLAASR